MYARVQVDIDFNTEPKFSCSSSFSPTTQWALKTNQTHETAFFFIHLVGLEESESDPFVNKQPTYNTKESFVKESADLLSLADNLSY